MHIRRMVTSLTLRLRFNNLQMLDEPRACMRPWCSKIINESMENKEPAMVIYWVDMAKEEQPIDLKDSEAGEERVQERLEMERPWQPDVAKKSYKYHQKEETSVFCWCARVFHLLALSLTTLLTVFQ